ncbi:putative ankyrin repeat protein RF_0381 [Halyomorpha halys]|uniref:putative ankyrin repeat protein RF_0381 n=1 Tax=Halyomorpha halys TaxID=286706 RepID=UPI0006D520A1|nr:serine/threonine-protein phosphatase 6 regulatory ankyrin repeat subunit B-like [Halyomorpha halys]
MAILQQSLERMVLLGRNTILDKILAGASYGARAYIYKGAAVADMELNSPQYLLLALLYSLVTEEVMSCCQLADVCHQVRQLQSDYLRAWLSGEFVFPCQDVEKAMALLAKLLKSGVLKLPSHVTRIMSSLATKYRVPWTTLLQPSMEGHKDLANHLEEAVIRNSHADIIAIANEGGDVNGSTQSGESLIHLAVRHGNFSSIAALGFLKANLECLNFRNATPLEEAVKNNCLNSVKGLLSAGAKVDKLFFRGDTYLHIAAARHLNGPLNVLLEKLDANKKNNFDETPLFQAIRAGNVLGMQMLLEKGADAKIFHDGKSLLEIVVESQNLEVFKTLMVNGGTNLRSKVGDTVFHLVARYGNIEMLRVIKKMNLPENFKNNNNLTPLHIASDLSVLETFIRMGLNVNDKTKYGETPLHLASEKGSFELVRTLCQKGAAVNMQDASGTTALMSASECCKEDIVNFLLHNGANLKIKDEKGQTALHYAAGGGCVGIVASLLEAGAKVDDRGNEGNTPAFVAAINNKTAVLKLLVENGADLNLRYSHGDGILHRCAYDGEVEEVTTLLAAGAEVDIKHKDNESTPLMLAASEGHIAIVKALLDAGADVNSKNKFQCTALHQASLEGHIKVLMMLLDAGADLEAREEHGCTPLMGASQHGHLAAVKLLLRRGALINARDDYRSTALSRAIHTNVINYLKSKGGLY